MTLAHRPDLVAAHHDIVVLAAEAEALVRAGGPGAAWSAPVRDLLGRSVRQLAAIADEIVDDERGAMPVLDLRDELAAHLRAADHIRAAGGRDEVYADLLARAVAKLTTHAADYGA